MNANHTVRAFFASEPTGQPQTPANVSTGGISPTAYSVWFGNTISILEGKTAPSFKEILEALKKAKL